MKLAFLTSEDEEEAEKLLEKSLPMSMKPTILPNNKLAKVVETGKSAEKAVNEKATTIKATQDKVDTAKESFDIFRNSRAGSSHFESPGSF